MPLYIAKCNIHPKPRQPKFYHLIPYNTFPIALLWIGTCNESSRKKINGKEENQRKFSHTLRLYGFIGGSDLRISYKTRDSHLALPQKNALVKQTLESEPRRYERKEITCVHKSHNVRRKKWRMQNDILPVLSHVNRCGCAFFVRMARAGELINVEM